MRLYLSPAFTLSAIALSAVAAACSDEPPPEAIGGSGGHVASGGSVATGGNTPMGGNVATGGNVASGGSIATGGTVATGGNVGMGGAGGGFAAPGGYVTSGEWKGYAWTSPGSVAGTTIEPPNFTAHTGGPLCASGTVAADPEYGGVAILGINVNQAAEENSPILTLTPAGTGVSYDVTNNGTSALRIQIQGPNGENDPNDRWCAAITAPTGTIAWADFNTECWPGGAGTAYANAPLSAVMVLVPGSNMTETPYSFCINSMGPG